jgi:hypothetical protein
MPQRRRRVLHVIPTARSGGIETFVLRLARRLARSRFELSVCVSGEDGPVGDELRSLGVAVSALRMAPGARSLSR